jgi:transposase
MKQPHLSIVVGLDVGDRKVHVYAMDFETGEVLAEGAVPTTRTAVRRYLGSLGKARVVLEVGTHSRWLSVLLEEMGHEVLVANARKLRMIYAGTNKQDRLDARKLAMLGHAEPQLLYPVRHRGAQAHEDLAVVRARSHLVRQRTATINLMRGMVKAAGERLPRCASHRFADRVVEEIPEGLKAALEPLRRVVDLVDEAIVAYDKELAAMAKERYPETEVLTQVHGVGTLTALAFMLTLEDPGRFRKSRDVGPALGLVPRRDQSGDRDAQLGVTKTGDSYLRTLLVEAAQHVLQERSPDSDLKRWGTQRAARGGKIARHRAVVALARRIAVLLHRLWVTGERYEPLRNAAA